ncbi:glycosyltransferase family 4 protein [Mucilaginibacter ginkgonis]|uniref:Glycosyltransferase family 4 protein n=1 Tax=Mucilaginibacter ginkgonis TaxID=2682091 RepID=A0A6I4IP58_9SPHI|nr:glycosyltransferase family 1 protein [Mucilaginibacter ginkgonis]QQL49182.1 glycosyltransferase family 4 protein [Mucilaginibacter ginkgonis]
MGSKILVTFDSMKNINTGYYYFGLGLGNALIDANNDEFDLTFYLHNRTNTRFNGDVKILRLSKLHPFYFPYRNRFQLVHITDQECRLRPEWVNAKKIMTIHDVNRIHLEGHDSPQTRQYLERLRKFISGVDKLVTISQFVADDIVKLYPEAASKISVIYNGAQKPQLVKNYKPAVIPNGDFLFTIGILLPQKGFHYLPNLLENNNLNLVIAGIETPHKEVILAEAKKYGCENRVFITGPVADVDKAWYYANCKAFIFPSSAEGFGLPVIEAMHFGKPVFLAKKTSLPEIGGRAAYYFDSFEPQHMRDVLADGLKDFEENNRTNEVLRQTAKFTWENAAKAYLQLYKQTLDA